MNTPTKRLNKTQLLAACEKNGWDMPTCRQLTKRELIYYIDLNESPPVVEAGMDATGVTPAEAADETGDEAPDMTFVDGDVAGASEPKEKVKRVKATDPLTIAFEEVRRLRFDNDGARVCCAKVGKILDSEVMWALNHGKSNYVAAVIQLKGKDNRETVYVASKDSTIIEDIVAEMETAGLDFTTVTVLADKHDGGDYILATLTITPPQAEEPSDEAAA